MTQKVSGGNGTWHIRIRPAAYRMKSGYSVSGHDEHQRRIDIFVWHRATAEAVRDAVQRGDNPDPIIMAEKA